MTPVTIQQITKRFGSVVALDKVSLEIAAGELFFLLGPSGCGKTTLLRTIAGFYRPDGGSVRLGDQDVTRVPPQRRDTGMVFQNYALWPHMTVAANVGFGLSVRRVPRRERARRIAEALDLVQMGSYAQRKPNQLSGGQQQRVALARALVIRPRCLLLDEPLSNLDAKLRLDMRTEIRRLCKEFGLTGIYVTHDQKEALSIADRMAVMFDGQVGQVGTPRALYKLPADPRIADFLGETNFLEATVTAAEGERRQLDSPLGPLTATAGEAPRSGRCLLSIRPEAVELGVKDGSANAVTCRITERIYLGEATQLTLARGDVTLYARVVEHVQTTPPAIGAEVTVSIDPREIVILSSTRDSQAPAAQGLVEEGKDAVTP